MNKTFRDDSTHLNKQLSSENSWSDMKRKGTDAFRNLLNTNIKASFILRKIDRRTTLITYRYAMGKKKNAYAKFRCD